MQLLAFRSLNDNYRNHAVDQLGADELNQKLEFGYGER